MGIALAHTHTPLARSHRPSLAPRASFARSPAPKRGKSAYFFFMDDERPKQKEANPGASVADLAKLMGAEWNKIKGTAAAKKYEDQAAKDKTRYEKEKAAYEAKK